MALQAVGPIRIWEAFSDPGKPWCVAPAADVDGGFGVNLYFSKKGKIKGVVVYDKDNDYEYVAVLGKVPKSERA